MRIEYDKEAQASYIYVRKGKPAKTIKLMDSLLVDLDKKNNLVGIEILGPVPAKERGRVRTNFKVPVAT
ncbi:hypothetical protein COX26_00125 [Candidatus Jorgensenbacteria bacterium CG23_combo_of_CG06-09_8_20_14_all_54_14]|uniref:DUF2283 domain-containing protein n=1 Tax=Candidatus Jorgensenbacteria bacterium CG23_combo_of_CG06-09_8_20_14_all_54_14 TaxID=1974595 RepID=A0A2G9ZCT3_9BACT|nr:MAG: hypothetical protein COX26_00125 [Candidatus Jorgensenbacteria bacterium CG23_combo_of_CG06-09_8_20_14_all_54_14]